MYRATIILTNSYLLLKVVFYNLTNLFWIYRDKYLQNKINISDNDVTDNYPLPSDYKRIKKSFM